MAFAYTDLEGMICRILDQLQANFSGNWPLHPGAAVLESLPLTQSQRDHMLSYQDAHRSVRLEFCCVLEGDMALQVEDRFYAMHPGDLYLIPSGVLHNELSDGRACTTAWFVFFPNGVHINVSGFAADGNFHVYHGQRVILDPVVVNLIVSEIDKELGSARPGAMTLVKGSLLQVLVLLQRQLQKLGQRQPPEQWRQSVVRDVISHLQENPGAVPDLSQLADHCALSPNHLSSIFKSVTGKTISAYCGELRIRRAEELLRTTPMKLRQIAELLGYYDQYHFCKAFKKATGLSPSAYRAEDSGK